jgi:class I fructose-bisphosphate aldolase
MGMFTVLWCYLRNRRSRPRKSTTTSRRSDGPGQPPRRHDPGRHHQAEAAETNGGFNAINFGKTHKALSQLSSDNPIDLTRYQLANCYMGRSRLINSGGASAGKRPEGSGEDRRDQQARGGTGLIPVARLFSGR